MTIISTKLVYLKRFDFEVGYFILARVLLWPYLKIPEVDTTERQDISAEKVRQHMVS